MIDLKDRILKRIAVLEGCTHQLCSMTDEAAEHAEARSLRQLICEHGPWRIFKNKQWEIVDEPQPNDPCGCYCSKCGISLRGTE